MKRTRTSRSDAANQLSKCKRKKGKGLSDIKSPTFRTLIRMLRVGTGEVTPNNISKAEADEHIRRLAGEYTPEVALAKRYAGREALQELMSNYIGKPITFQQACDCFDNPRNRGLQATPALYALLAGKKWPPYPRTSLCAHATNELVTVLKTEHEEPILKEEDETFVCHTKSSHELMVVLQSLPGVKLPVSASVIDQESRMPFGKVITTGFFPSRYDSHVVDFDSYAEEQCRFVSGSRPVITTGFVKSGTPFQAESEVSSYARLLGVRYAKLELRSFQLHTHNHNPPAAIVAIRRHPTLFHGDSYAKHIEKPISLLSLRLSSLIDATPRSMYCKASGITK